MFGLGINEILIIAVVISILFFGGKKMSDFARSAGRFTGEFKKGKMEMEQELENIKKNVNSELDGVRKVTLVKKDEIS